MCNTSPSYKQEEDIMPSKEESTVLKRDTDIGNHIHPLLGIKVLNLMVCTVRTNTN